MEHINEKSLVESWKLGDINAGEQLCNKHIDHIYSMMVNSLTNVEDAEDLTQDVILRAFEHIDDFKQDSSFSTWLYGIAKNVLRSHYNKKNQIEKAEVHITPEIHSFIQNIPIQESSYDEIFRSSETRILVWDALQHISHLQRQALLLRFWNNISYKVIAQEMGKTESAIKSLIYRGVQSCAKYISSRLTEKKGKGGERE